MSYTQLTHEQRYQIYSLLKAGLSQTEIAKNIGVHKSTISREIRRNRGLRGYRPKQANNLAISRLARKSKPKITQEAWQRVEVLLKEEWSPEQISHWLKNEENTHVSHEWIYRYIYEDKANGGTLYKSLRCLKIRRKRYGSYERRGTLRNRVSIDKRPVIVDKRKRFGDWEADTVCGQQTGPRLVTLVERKSRFTKVGLAKNKSAESVTEVILSLLQEHGDKVRTITYDNGKEFAEHERISKQTQSKGYFADPYQSWQRGLNENTNGLLRQYFAKGSDFKLLSVNEVIEAENKLNDRPRKCLGFKTPNQVFLGINPPVALVD